MDKFVTLLTRAPTKTVCPLTDNSWVDVWADVYHCTPDEFDAFWQLRPTERHEILIMGKWVKIARFQKLYGAGSYAFSGTVMHGDPEIPPFVLKCLEVARTLYPEFAAGFNGALCNWYPDGASYIGPHSDDERDLVPGAPILSFSFGAVRTFRIKAKGEKSKAMDFPTRHGSMLAMCGAMQKEFKHEITKTAMYVGPRINVTIRCFKSL